MYKGTIDIEQDVFTVAESFFADVIGGSVYREDCRPVDSVQEDAVVVVSFGTNEQIQSASAYVNIYVPDLRNKTKKSVPDKSRLAELSALDEAFVNALNDVYLGEYDFSFGSSTSIHMVPDISQHFISINLSIKRITFND